MLFRRVISIHVSNYSFGAISIDRMSTFGTYSKFYSLLRVHLRIKSNMCLWTPSNTFLQQKLRPREFLFFWLWPHDFEVRTVKRLFSWTGSRKREYNASAVEIQKNVDWTPISKIEGLSNEIRSTSGRNDINFRLSKVTHIFSGHWDAQLNVIHLYCSSELVVMNKPIWTNLWYWWNVS